MSLGGGLGHDVVGAERLADIVAKMPVSIEPLLSANALLWLVLGAVWSPSNVGA